MKVTPDPFGLKPIHIIPFVGLAILAISITDYPPIVMIVIGLMGSGSLVFWFLLRIAFRINYETRNNKKFLQEIKDDAENNQFNLHIWLGFSSGSKVRDLLEDCGPLENAATRMTADFITEAAKEHISSKSLEQKGVVRATVLKDLLSLKDQMAREGIKEFNETWLAKFHPTLPGLINNPGDDLSAFFKSVNKKARNDSVIISFNKKKNQLISVVNRLLERRIIYGFQGSRLSIFT